MFWVTLACRNFLISIPRRFQHKKVSNKFPGRGQADWNFLDKWSYAQKVSDESFLRILKVKCGQVPPAAVPKRHPRKVSAYCDPEKNVSKILAPENIMFGKMAKSPGRPAESSPRTISPKLSILVKPEQTISKTCILGWSKPHQSFVQIRKTNVPGI